MDKNIRLALSQYLFSSFTIDRGTNLLIKTILNNFDLSTISSTLDIGCGVGVLGIALKMFNRSMIVHAQDRDSIAVDFTRYNFNLNNLDGYTAEGALALENSMLPSYDLIVSNLPAKAGLPVLEYIIRNAPNLLTPDGLCAFVIVKPLREFFTEILNKIDAEQIITVHDSGHSVFIFRTKHKNKNARHIQPSGMEYTLTPYFRNKFYFKKTDISFILETVYGLPNFDSIDFSTSLMLDLIDYLKIDSSFKNILIHNPGQGHVPLYLIKKYSPSSIVISGRDILSLKASMLNIIKNGFPIGNITMHHSVLPPISRKKYDFIAILPYGSHTLIDKDFFLDEINKIFTSGSICSVTGQSYLITRFLNNLKKLKNFTIIKKGKNKGNRVILISTG